MSAVKQLSEHPWNAWKREFTALSLSELGEAPRPGQLRKLLKTGKWQAVTPAQFVADIKGRMQP